MGDDAARVKVVYFYQFAAEGNQLFNLSFGKVLLSQAQIADFDAD